MAGRACKPSTSEPGADKGNQGENQAASSESTTLPQLYSVFSEAAALFYIGHSPPYSGARSQRRDIGQHPKDPTSRVVGVCSFAQDILAAASTKKCGAIAPAWGGPSFPRAGDGDTDNFSHHDQSGRHQEKRDPQADPAPGGNSAEGKKSEPPPQSSKELADFELERQELERARSEDLQTDCSHVQQLRALVAEFVHGTRKPRTRRLLSGSAAHPDHRDPLPPQDRDDPVHFSNVAREDPMVPKTGNSVGEKVADKHEAGTSTDLTPPLTRRPHSAELGSRAGFVAQLLVQVSETCICPIYMV